MTRPHWRPQHYYPRVPPCGSRPASTVSPSAQGLYGQADAAASFRIGDAHISVANDITKQVSVFSNGTLMRTMPTSMGMGGSKPSAGAPSASGPSPGSTR